MKKWLRIFSLLVIFLGTIGSQVHAESIAKPQAQIALPPSGCFAMDVVFVVDQSNSMSGIVDGSPNDPLRQRINAPRYALDWLANNRLALCKDVTHRIGVISFGTDTAIDLPMTSIEPDDQMDWDAVSSRLEANIQERFMNGTDPVLAFKEAGKMLDSLPPEGTYPRKRMIILLTDGQPCVPGKGCSFGPDDPVNKEYMQLMVDNLNKDFPFSPNLHRLDLATEQAVKTFGGASAIPDNVRSQIFIDNPVSEDDFQNSTYIYIVAMNSAKPYLESVGNYFQEIAESHDGQLINLQINAIEVPRVFNDLLSEMAGITPTLLGCGNLPVDPYLSGAILDVFRVAEGLEVKVQADGRNLTAGVGDTDYFGMQQYSEFGAVEHYRFVQPPAGLWKIDAVNCDGIEASFIAFNPKVKQLEPANSLPHYDLNGAVSDPAHPFYLRYQILDQETDTKLDLNPDYPIDMQATIVGPSGIEQQLAMEFDTNGEWVSKDPVPVNVLGEYHVKVIGRAPCVKNPDDPAHCPEGTFEVVNDENGKYEVAPVTIFNISVLEPGEGETYPLHGKLIPDKLAVEPLTVRVQLQDDSSTPLAGDRVFTGDLDQAFKAELTVNGQSNSVYFTPVPGSVGVFEAVFDSPAGLGMNALTISMEGEYHFETYRPYNLPVTLTFERHDKLLRSPLFYKVLLIIAIILAAGLIGKLIWDHTNVVKGSLVFKRGYDDEQRLSLSKKRRVVVFRANKSHMLKESGVKKLTIRNAGTKNRTAYIQVEIVPLKGTKRNVKLADSLGPMGGGQQLVVNDFMIMYERGGQV